MVIAPRKSSRLVVRRVSVAGGASPKDWNFLLFGTPGLRGKPHGRDVVESVEYKHLDLFFETVEAREDFAHRLFVYTQMYKKAREEYLAAKQEDKHEADRPKRNFVNSLYRLKRRPTAASLGTLPEIPSVSSFYLSKKEG
jgi:hypothetical protein